MGAHSIAKPPEVGKGDENATGVLIGYQSEAVKTGQIRDETLYKCKNISLKC